MSKENKKLIEEINLTVEQEAPSFTGIPLQAGLDRTIKAIEKVAERTDNNESNTKILNSGTFDVNGDGTKITKIFDANGDLISAGGGGAAGTFEDLTALTTAGEVYAAVKVGGFYKINIFGQPTLFSCQTKNKDNFDTGIQDTIAYLAGWAGSSDGSDFFIHRLECPQGSSASIDNTSQGIWENGVIRAGTPDGTNTSQVATVGYVSAHSAGTTGSASHNANEHFKGEFADETALPATGTLGDYAFVGSGDTFVIYEYVDSTGDGTGDKWETANVAAPSGGGAAIDENRLVRYGAHDQLAIGIDAQKTLASDPGNAIAIGWDAGSVEQSRDGVAIGAKAGMTNQGKESIAIGGDSGLTKQGYNSIAIGYKTGRTNQGNESISIGNSAGNNLQGSYAVAIGNNAGEKYQKDHSISIGEGAGNEEQGLGAIAIGYGAGTLNQGKFSIAIGPNSGYYHLPDNSISITTGYSASGNVLGKEGDITIETINTNNSNDNKLEVKDGKLYVNGKEVAFV